MKFLIILILSLAGAAAVFVNLGGDTRLDGASVISTGEALGHGTWVDLDSIRILHKLVEGKKVKAYMNHHSATVPEAIGYFENFRMMYLLDGQGALLGDLVLYDHEVETWRVRKLIEMVNKTPELIGISVVIGLELEEVGGKKFIRPTKIYSADVVAYPAANEGGWYPKNHEVWEAPPPSIHQGSGR